MYRMLLVSVLLLTCCAACTDDDTATDIALEDAALSFVDSLDWILARPPTALLALEDIPATETVRHLSAANRVLRMTKDMYFRFDKSIAQIVDTAVVDSEPGVRYRAYLWKISNVDIGYAYQISIEKNNYVFKRYQRVMDRFSWQLEVSAEESVDRTAGLLKVYGYNHDPVPLRSFSWNLDGDDYSLDVLSPGDDYKSIHVKINQRTRAGSVVATENVILEDAEAEIKFQSQWTESGAGTWTQYDAQGNVVDSGVWEPTN